MELFQITRYGDETEQKSIEVHENLSKLRRRIEERKKQRATIVEGTTEITKPVENETKNSNKSQKSRKRKIQVQSNDEISMHNSPKTLDGDNPEQCTQESAEENKKFTVLGSTFHKKRGSVKRVLPPWLANPQVISADLNSGQSLDELDDEFDQQLIGVLKANNINRLFPVQEKLMKWMSKCIRDKKMGWWPRDTCVSAPTGSGKTLAYVLPIIQYLQHKFIREIRCLIVTPVQELAAQVHKVLTTYSSHTNLKIGLVSGAMPIEAEQMNLIKKTYSGQFISRVDIIVATPGRLVDHIEKTQGFSLNNLEFLIIDEADRSTEWLKYIPMPHRCAPIPTIKNIKSYSVPPAQKLLFSATLSQDPEKLSRLGLFQPILFTSVVVVDCDDDVDLDKEVDDLGGKYTSPHELTERAIECSPEHKPLALVQLFTEAELLDKALIFTNSGEAAHRLAILLQSLLKESNIVVDELSAHLFPKQRFEVLEKFISGQTRVLVSSDALARGLDIPGVKLVVSYDLPKHIKGYIHRAGRTGRAGLPGTAISILTSNQIELFNRMLSSAHKALPTIERIESLELLAETINYQSHLEQLKKTIEEEQIKNTEKIKAAKRRRVNKKSNAMIH